MIDHAKIAQTFNKFLRKIIDTKNTKQDKNILCDTGNETDPPICIINKCSKHPSILRLSKSFRYLSKLSFVPVDKDIIAKEIKNLDPKKLLYKMILLSSY